TNRKDEPPMTDAYIASYDAQYAPHQTEYDYAMMAMQTNRIRIAADLRELRALPHAGRMIAKAHLTFLRANNRVCDKPTVGWFRRNAIAALREARAPLPWERDRDWVNPGDTESYSACGYADGLEYRREQAREYAPV